MTGHHSGPVKRVQEVAPAAVWSHCIIHWNALAAKKMAEELRVVLGEAVKIVNLIKSRPLNARLCSILFNQLFLHSDVRWFSRAKVLTRLCDLRKEVVLSPRHICLMFSKGLICSTLLCSAMSFWYTESLRSGKRWTCGVLAWNKARWKCFQPWRMFWRRHDWPLTL